MIIIDEKYKPKNTQINERIELGAEQISAYT